MKAFITGTDTSVGKTRVALALLQEAGESGLRRVALKPVETGCAPGSEPMDALALWHAQEGSGPVPEWLCRYRYRRPASPEAAVRSEPGQPSPDLDHIRRDWVEHTRGADLALCEGAGGLCVPLSKDLSTPRLVEALDLPVLVVARPGLGTINHTLLTIEAIRHRGLKLLGFVLNGYRGESERAFAEENAEDITRHGDARCLALLPWAKAAQDAEFRAASRRLLAALVEGA